MTPLFTVEALLGPVVDVGDTQLGRRRVIPIVGGTVHGGLSGVVLPGGADWNLVLPDGSNELWARYELALDDGAVVSVTNVGVHPPGADLPILTTPRFEVADDGPVHLRAGVHVALVHPQAGGDRVVVEVHAVTVAR